MVLPEALGTSAKRDLQRWRMCSARHRGFAVEVPQLRFRGCGRGTWQARKRFGKHGGWGLSGNPRGLEASPNLFEVERREAGWSVYVKGAAWFRRFVQKKLRGDV